MKYQKTKHIGFSRKIVITGDQRNYVHILQRVLNETTIGQIEPTVSFTEIWACFAKIETIKPTVRFDGVTIEDMPTHICILPFYQVVFDLDLNTLFIKDDKTVPRYYKLKSIEDIGNQNQFIEIYMKETGRTEQEAAQG
jgi:hypothetical protein